MYRSCKCFSWQNCTCCPGHALTPQSLLLPPNHAQPFSLLTTLGRCLLHLTSSVQGKEGGGGSGEGVLRHI